MQFILRGKLHFFVFFIWLQVTVTVTEDPLRIRIRIAEINNIQRQRKADPQYTLPKKMSSKDDGTRIRCGSAIPSHSTD
jgi:hypothetical protein